MKPVALRPTQRGGGTRGFTRRQIAFAFNAPAHYHALTSNQRKVMASNHTWRFFRAGGFDQVRLDSGADLVALDELDQKLWVALACPTSGLEFDSKTLNLIDSDKDGRIRAPELIAAAKWAGERLKNPDSLLKCSPSLPLAAINDRSEERRVGKECR